MCRKCSGWRSEVTGQWIEGDGNTSRHTVQPPDLDHPNYGAWLVRQRNRNPPPVPVEHGTVRGIRSHRRKQEDLCSACDEYCFTPAYYREIRQQSLDTVNRKLSSMASWGAEGGDVDQEYRAYLERKRARLEKQLFGGDEPVKKQRSAEPMELIHVRVPVRMIDSLKERAEEEETSVSELVRQALDAFFLL